jgi:hypothetical protein
LRIRRILGIVLPGDTVAGVEAHIREVVDGGS